MRRISLLALLCACNAGFEDPEIVVDLRVLAIEIEPAEVVVDFDPQNPTNVTFPTVAFRALAIDPAGGRHGFRFTACPQQDNRRCDSDVSPHLILGEGVVEAGKEEITANLDMTLELIEGAIREDPFRGFGGVPVNVELRIVREGEGEAQALYAAKQMIYAPRVPASRTPNQNPRMTGLVLQGTPFGDCPMIAPRTEVRIDPVDADGVRETYVVPTLDGGERTFTENLRYAWFATRGSFSSGNTGGPTDAFGNQPPRFTKWTSPDVPGNVRLWVVQRDERGGTFWTERCLLVKN